MSTDSKSIVTTPLASASIRSATSLELIREIEKCELAVKTDPIGSLERLFQWLFTFIARLEPSVHKGEQIRAALGSFNELAPNKGVWNWLKTREYGQFSWREAALTLASHRDKLKRVVETLRLLCTNKEMEDLDDTLSAAEMNSTTADLFLLSSLHMTDQKKLWDQVTTLGCGVFSPVVFTAAIEEQIVSGKFVMTTASRYTDDIITEVTRRIQSEDGNTPCMSDFAHFLSTVLKDKKMTPEEFEKEKKATSTVREKPRIPKARGVSSATTAIKTSTAATTTAASSMNWRRKSEVKISSSSSSPSVTHVAPQSVTTATTHSTPTTITSSGMSIQAAAAIEFHAVEASVLQFIKQYIDHNDLPFLTSTEPAVVYQTDHTYKWSISGLSQLKLLLEHLIRATNSKKESPQNTLARQTDDVKKTIHNVLIQYTKTLEVFIHSHQQQNTEAQMMRLHDTAVTTTISFKPITIQESYAKAAAATAVATTQQMVDEKVLPTELRMVLKEARTRNWLERHKRPRHEFPTVSYMFRRNPVLSLNENAMARIANCFFFTDGDHCHHDLSNVLKKCENRSIALSRYYAASDHAVQPTATMWRVKSWNPDVVRSLRATLSAIHSMYYRRLGQPLGGNLAKQKIQPPHKWFACSKGGSDTQTRDCFVNQHPLVRGLWCKWIREAINKLDKAILTQDKDPTNDILKANLPTDINCLLAFFPMPCDFNSPLAGVNHSWTSSVTRISPPINTLSTLIRRTAEDVLDVICNRYWMAVCYDFLQINAVKLVTPFDGNVAGKLQSFLGTLRSVDSKSMFEKLQLPNSIFPVFGVPHTDGVITTKMLETHLHSFPFVDPAIVIDRIRYLLGSVLMTTAAEQKFFLYAGMIYSRCNIDNLVKGIYEQKTATVEPKVTWSLTLPNEWASDMRKARGMFEDAIHKIATAHSSQSSLSSPIDNKDDLAMKQKVMNEPSSSNGHKVYGFAIASWIRMISRVVKTDLKKRRAAVATTTTNTRLESDNATTIVLRLLSPLFEDLLVIASRLLRSLHPNMDVVVPTFAQKHGFVEVQLFRHCLRMVLMTCDTSISYLKPELEKWMTHTFSANDLVKQLSKTPTVMELTRFRENMENGFMRPVRACYYAWVNVPAPTTTERETVTKLEVLTSIGGTKNIWLEGIMTGAFTPIERQFISDVRKSTQSVVQSPNTFVLSPPSAHSSY